ncbi:MAG: bifunctional diaminohydroxyphosphoribosylaminopyrimidine deaminase/5-amino-6-(5-phosphoribosylamino)uracil reductase RibD [Phycisphaerae bacterium]|nr:bifunctional diaminohydroxyphosphoribosylaminopyrimidine deaminase/5-amino-6-(5-phosphoribosylamino)uracil reductase RibD [Phycisphaerae bacterium]
MRRALDEAVRGVGAVEPNPPVGAVLVRDGEVIGLGHHQQFGGPHAERRALADAADLGNDPAAGTLYVTLEPCCGFAGKKTPPCTEAIIEAGVSRVVVAIEDPDPNVAGRGCEQLRQAGVDVQVGCGETDARELMRAYIKLRTQRRPWVIAKWAQTADGYVALDSQGASDSELRQWISNEASRRHAHTWRGIVDGVLVGVGTVLADNPILTDRRHEATRQPTRVILDATLRTPLDCRLVTSIGEARTLVATTRQACRDRPATVDRLRSAGVEILDVTRKPVGGSRPEPAGLVEGVDVQSLLDALGERNWTRLLVEGGPTVLRSFLDPRLADELHVYVGPHEADDPRQPRFDLADVLKAGRYVETAAEDLEGDTLFILRKT